MNSFYNIDIPLPKEDFVTLSYLRSSPTFGSKEWSKISFDTGAKALFTIDTKTKEEVLELCRKERDWIIVETMGVEDGSMQLHMKPVYVIDEE